MVVWVYIVLDAKVCERFKARATQINLRQSSKREGFATCFMVDLLADQLGWAFDTIRAKADLFSAPHGSTRLRGF